MASTAAADGPTDCSDYVLPIPDQFSLAELLCDRHAAEAPECAAVLEYSGPGPIGTRTYGDLQRRSRALAGALSQAGVSVGDRVAVDLRQGFEALALHVGIFRLGAISVPLSPTFAGDGLRHRLGHSGSKVACGDSETAPRIAAVERPATLEHIIDVQNSSAGDVNLSALLEASVDVAGSARYEREQPAFIFYTSGSSGPPKGATMGARMVHAMVPGFRMVSNGAPRDGDVIWTPSDWAWLGSLGEFVLPTAFLGLPIAISSGRFAVDRAYDLLERCQVTCPFLVPAVLRRMRDTPPEPSRHLALRVVMTGGETLDPELRRDIESVLGAVVNDDYGLTEGTYLAMGCASRFRTPPGAVGRPSAGRTVVILDRERDEPLGPGQQGEIAVDAHDPIVMLGYWNGSGPDPEFSSRQWLRTGDTGSIDSEGFLWFDARNSELLKVSGIRISAGEIERALMRHRQVADVGVVLTPEGGREILSAYVVAHAEPADPEALAQELQQLVRDQVAAYAHPRRVVFAASLPQTASGKLDRQRLRREGAGR
jgi:acetyl-CoA synthetase